MERKKSKILFFLFLLFLEIFSSGQLKAEAIIESKMETNQAGNRNGDVAALNNDDRITKLEAKSKHQEIEIASLKSGAIQDKKTINQLTTRVTGLEAQVEKLNAADVTRALQRPKRSSELSQPKKRTRKTKKKKTGPEMLSPEEEGVGPFYGPATSCQELGKLGYTLNGLYLLLGKDSNSNKKKKDIQIVQCEFHQPQMESEILETAIGNFEATGPKTNISFSVDRSSFKALKDGVLYYDTEHYNVGGGMNLTTGIFTVPVAGTYLFDYSSVTRHKNSNFMVQLQVNGVNVAASKEDHESYESGEGRNRNRGFYHVTLKSSQRLKVGDQVDLYETSDSMIFGGLIHFKGSLTEED